MWSYIGVVVVFVLFVDVLVGLLLLRGICMSVEGVVRVIVLVLVDVCCSMVFIVFWIFVWKLLGVVMNFVVLFRMMGVWLMEVMFGCLVRLSLLIDVVDGLLGVFLWLIGIVMIFLCFVESVKMVLLLVMMMLDFFFSLMMGFVVLILKEEIFFMGMI